MELITGHSGEAHVKAEDDAALHKGIISTSPVVLAVDEKLSAEKIYNNQVRIHSGAAVFQGRLARIRTNTYDTVTIENGTADQMRKDIIVIQYTKTEGIEATELVVKKGTPGVSASDPQVSSDADIDGGDVLYEMPLYRVTLSGLNITSVEPLFTVVDPMDVILKNINTSLSGKAPSVHNHTRSQITDLSGASVSYANSAGSAGNATRASSAASADSVAWGNVSGKPGSYPPSGHTHDDRYYTELEINNLLAVQGGTFTENAVGFKFLSGDVRRVGKMVAVNLYVKSYDGVMGNTNELHVGTLNPKPVAAIPFYVIDDGAKRPLAAKITTNGSIAVTGDKLTGERYLLISVAYASA